MRDTCRIFIQGQRPFIVDADKAIKAIRYPEGSSLLFDRHRGFTRHVAQLPDDICWTVDLMKLQQLNQSKETPCTDPSASVVGTEELVKGN